MLQSSTGAVLVVGGGVTGMQAALDAADSGYYVYLVERSPSIGGMMSQLDKTFPTNDCSLCILSPKLVEVGRHPNIELLTLAQVTAFSGDVGHFQVGITQFPRYVDINKCIACGLCEEKCPKKVLNSFNGGLAKRKAIHLPYPQAVPLKYAIDPSQCIYLTKGKCQACQKVCPAEAINFDERPRKIGLTVGAVILAAGGRTYDPTVQDSYGYSRSADIVTSLEFERILSASGPFGGHLVRPSNGQPPSKIAWFQCVGSRQDCGNDNGYCSSVCCSYAIKEALLAKEHATGNLDTTIFYMDMRTHGKDFELLYNRARNEAGVRFIQSRIPHVTLDIENNTHLVRYIDAVGRRVEESFDMVVLSVGLRPGLTNGSVATLSGLAQDRYGFVRTSDLAPIQTSRPGILVCGTIGGPKDIPQSVVESSAAAGLVAACLKDARWTQTKQEKPHEITDVHNEPPRIGVFVCQCGTNIAATVDVPAVVEHVRFLPHVVHAEENMFSCSQDSQDRLVDIIKNKGINRVVVSACSPKTHEALFQQTMLAAGINKYLFEMANIRNHCSWVHGKEPGAATQKAKDLTRMAVARVAFHQPLDDQPLEITQAALVIGAGIAGMKAARTLTAQGHHVFLVEKSNELGGNALHLHETWRGESVHNYLKDLIEAVFLDDKIDVCMSAHITEVKGFVGNYQTTIQTNGREEVIHHGVTIIATGAQELKPTQYLYESHYRVITALELNQRFVEDSSTLASLKQVVFIQCCGSRNPERPYCSKVCCTQSLKSALQLKKMNPAMEIFILYRDMRTYGHRETLYRRARRQGIHTLQYDEGNKLTVTEQKDRLCVSFTDTAIRRKMEIHPDLLVLATAMVPSKDNPVARFYKVPQDDNGFFVEAHVKLRPVDCATDGVFICGLAHGPKPVDESIAQAQAAASRAAGLLSRKTVFLSGAIAKVDPSRCSGCAVCVSICPFSAPVLQNKGPDSCKAEVNPALCKGCGLCAGSCRSEAICLNGFEAEQIHAQIMAALAN